MNLFLGVKSDPIEYRYSYEWLFDLMAESGVNRMQLGTFLEMYFLDLDWFVRLKEKAGQRGIVISSVFTSHRELGGLMSGDPDFGAVAIRNYRRAIEVGAALDADYVGSNIGTVYGDRMAEKAANLKRAMANLKDMSHYANENGLKALTIEPMSCLAEPPTLPEECAEMMADLGAYARMHRDAVPFYFCADTAHGYANAEAVVIHDNFSLFEAQIPHMCEFHFKNTDAIFNSTFGFSPEERQRGVVDLVRLRRLIDAKANAFPVSDVVGYLELSGPKTGRDYSDPLLGTVLKTSLAALRGHFDFSER